MQREVCRMNRGQFKQYILETYPCEANHPWIKYPNNEVFRHPGNRKWFALVMDVPKNKLGLAGSDVIDVVNLKATRSSSAHCGKNPASFRLTT